MVKISRRFVWKDNYGGEVPIIHVTSLPSMHRWKTSIGGGDSTYISHIKQKILILRCVGYFIPIPRRRQKKNYYLSEDTYARCFKTYMHDVSE